MSIQETCRVSLAFAVRPEDIITGHPAWPDDASLRIFSGDGLSRALAKDDGYFIFTEAKPDIIRVTSRIYEDFYLSLRGFPAKSLRCSMIPRNPAGHCVSLKLNSGECAHIGFYGKKSGYSLLPETIAGSAKITLNKNDYSDLTGLFHVLMHSDKAICHVFVSENLGYGRYRLSEPLPADYPVQGTRLLPLFRVTGGDGNMRIPVPNGFGGIFLLRDGNLQKISIEDWGLIG